MAVPPPPLPQQQLASVFLEFLGTNLGAVVSKARGRLPLHHAAKLAPVGHFAAAAMVTPREDEAIPVCENATFELLGLGILTGAGFHLRICTIQFGVTLAWKWYNYPTLWLVIL